MDNLKNVEKKLQLKEIQQEYVIKNLYGFPYFIVKSSNKGIEFNGICEKNILVYAFGRCEKSASCTASWPKAAVVECHGYFGKSGGWCGVLKTRFAGKGSVS